MKVFAPGAPGNITDLTIPGLVQGDATGGERVRRPDGADQTRGLRRTRHRLHSDAALA